MSGIGAPETTKEAPALLSSLAQSHPKLIRLGVLGAAILVTLAVMKLFSVGLGVVEERIGALG